MQAQFIHNPNGHGRGAHCASLVRAANGDLLCCWYTYPGDEDYKDAQLAIARMRPGRDSFSPSVGLLEKFSSSAGNPLFYVEEATGRLWLQFVLLKGKYWDDAVLHTTYSDDHGFTWSAPTVLWPDKGLMVRHAPLRLSGDDFLLPCYDEINNHTVLLRGCGLEWRITDAFSETPLIQPDLIRTSADTFCMLFRPTKEPRIVWRAQSGDQGKNWSNAIQTTLPCPLAGVAAFPTPDGYGAVYNHSEQSRYPLSIAITRDGGVTWSDPWHIEESNHEVSYPFFMIDENGDVIGVYTFNRRMLKFVRFSIDELYERTQ